MDNETLASAPSGATHVFKMRGDVSLGGGEHLRKIAHGPWAVAQRFQQLLTE